jgi:hypothetical protein
MLARCFKNINLSVQGCPVECFIFSLAHLRGVAVAIIHNICVYTPAHVQQGRAGDGEDIDGVPAPAYKYKRALVQPVQRAHSHTAASRAQAHTLTRSC